MKNPAPDSKHYGGFTLIEVMVALSVLALGLLGLALLQTTGLRMNTNSYSRTQATYAAYDIIERMRASVQGVIDPTTVANVLSLYNVPTETDAQAAIEAYESCSASTCDCLSGNCDSGALAAYDLGSWYAQQDRLVPGAKDAAELANEPQRATIAVAGNSATVTMYWIEQEGHEVVDPEPRSQSWQVEIY